MHDRPADIEASVLAYVRENGAAYFSELRLEIESGAKALQRALAHLTESSELVAHIEPGAYPNRVRYELPGPSPPLKPLPRERYWQADFGPPTRDAELNFEADLRMAAYYRQAQALRALSQAPRLAPEVLASGIEVAAVDDLASVGLAIWGVNLEANERTCRLSSLGRVVQQRLP